MASSNTKRLVLSSEFEDMERLEPFVTRLKKWAGFTEDDFSRILLTLSEAVNNAIVHGNREDPQKQVIIRSHLKNSEELEISIQDEGSGFDPDSIPDPLREENLLNEGGRGVYLIKHYADGVEFSENGTKIAILFRLKK